uniref:Atp-dependent rna helicase ddx5 isoform x2 n=1 Tax=Triatoma infestans TaxID=30076 RepID=A0A170X4Q5_TRIIF
MMRAPVLIPLSLRARMVRSLMPSASERELALRYVEDVKFVINFDFPNNSEDYVHRIGRTGRSKRTGTAYSFFTRSNAKQAAELVAILKEANQAVNPKLEDLAENYRLGGPGGRRRGFEIVVAVELDRGQ